MTHFTQEREPETPDALHDLNTWSERAARRGPRGASVAVFTFVVVATVFASLVSNRLVANQERSLLGERAGQIRTVFASSFDQSRLSLASLANAAGQDPADFDRWALPLIGQNLVGTVALIHREARGEVVTAAVGGSLQPGQVLGGERRDVVAQATLNDGQLASSYVFHEGNQRRLGLATVPGGGASDHIYYIEIYLNALDDVLITQSPAFRDVKVALYSKGGLHGDQVMVSTVAASELPLSNSISAPIRVGPDELTLTVAARSQMVGSVSHALPWMTLIGGLIFAVLVTLVTEVIIRRRDYAITYATKLVGERTASLRKRLDEDALLREAARRVAEAPDIQSALDNLFDVAKRVVPVDRAALSIIDNAEGKVVAVTGPEGFGLPLGYTSLLDDARVARMLMDQTPLILGGTFDRQITTMDSIVMLPWAAGGQVRSLISLATRTPNAYLPEHLPMLDALSRETGGALHQLMLLARERETTERLRELDELKNEFVGVVAHDIRSPLTVIDGFSKLLESDIEVSDDERNKHIAVIRENVTKLRRLTEDVLQVARIDAGELQIERRPFDLASLVSRTAKDIAEAHDHRPCVIHVPDAVPPAFGDEQRQWQVLSNLINNALKFSDVNQPVEVLMDLRDTEFEISVRDHGIGMKSEDLKLLFRKFSRATKPVSAETQPGTGLGLYICRTLVEAQGGRIWVDSEPGVGSTFRYTVPIAGSRSDADWLREGGSYKVPDSVDS